MQIVPGILTDDIEIFEKQLELCVGAAKKGLIEWAQIDFIDGEYAENKTITPDQFGEVKAKLSSESLALKFEAHLMVDKHNLNQWIKETLDAGFDRINFQIESIPSTEFFKQNYGEWLGSQGREIGLSLDVYTACTIDSKILSAVDLVQIMTVKAGAQGQKFIPEMLEKVKQLNELRIRNQELRFKIQVDGGVNEQIIQLAKAAGADSVIVGSALFGRGNFEENLEKLIELCGSGQRR